MPLTPGSRLGAFEILSPIGAGGMGEVYRARDTRLGRDIALKLLPDAVAGDPDRLARFEREARTLAALNHPNIAQIHGLEERALVMELVEGEDLSARITRGRVAVPEAIVVARQIAGALDAAHSAGIVHRDLKPANVKVRDDGVVKVLDFGLAKMGADAAGAFGASAPGAPGSARADALLTVTTPAVTEVGMILGTAAYMSPEQARGRPVDKRTDIWAFGCVLYEMLTGRAAFEGDTAADVFGAIVRSDPDWTRLPPDTPPKIARLLRRCLLKEVNRRLRDIGDAVADLDAGGALTASAADEAIVTPRARTRGMWMVSLILVALAAAALGYSLRPAPSGRLQKFHLAIQRDGGMIREPVISPDGRRIAYVGQSRIWVRAIDEWEPRELVGTEAATRPFWSADSAWIAYFRSESLLKVPAAGGPIVRVASLPAVQAPLGSQSGVWSEDGTITLSLASGRLLRVPGSGGDVREIALPPPDTGATVMHLRLLPGGALVGVVARADRRGAIVVDSAMRVVVEAPGARRPTFAAPGHLIFERREPEGHTGLWAVAFSVDRLETIGEPFPIGQGIEPTTARDGTLAFLGRREDPPRQLAWFSMEGVVRDRIADPQDWTEGAAVSPDGRRVLAATGNGIWAHEPETRAKSRITTNPTDLTPAWIDANRLVFVRTLDAQPAVMMKDLGAGDSERVLALASRFPRATEDGRRVVFNRRRDDSTWEVAWVDLATPNDIHTLPATHAGARFPSVSPDGSLVTYVSGEVGLDEIFLTRLPSGDGKWQVSTAGGGWATMSPRGDAVLYRAADGGFMSVPLSTKSGQVALGQPRRLFDWGAGWLPWYAIAPDGLSGVTGVPEGRFTHAPTVSIVQNWHLEFMSRD
ncbi:MAG: protein kinase domain-containing protein [Acidobacteriota bacterium]